MTERYSPRPDRNFLAFKALVPEATYGLYQQTLYGKPGELGRLYLTVTTNSSGELINRLERVRPALGGYRSEKKYGRPDYCPSGTRVHKKNIAEHGVSINLIYFDSVEVAVMAGFTPCGDCYLKGEEELTHWKEYLATCKKLGIEPGPPPKRFQK
ncbi:hypothetical protein HYU90_00080 [Candidatus Collierbacteria bacterium]|nr:hypothetical protein [Candidatus Collierbacteria bacterium]